MLPVFTRYIPTSGKSWCPENGWQQGFLAMTLVATPGPRSEEPWTSPTDLPEGMTTLSQIDRDRPGAIWNNGKFVLVPEFFENEKTADRSINIVDEILSTRAAAKTETGTIYVDLSNKNSSWLVDPSSRNVWAMPTVDQLNTNPGLECLVIHDSGIFFDANHTILRETTLTLASRVV